ncbi:hypothetical protein D3C78_1529230 [compost metagenome]
MIGARMIKPTSKKTGMPRINAAMVRAATVCFGPKALLKRWASDSAPPECSIIRPSIAPRPMIMVTEPSTPPIPAVITFITSPVGMPLANATNRLTTSKATKGWILALMTISKSSTTPNTAIIKSIEVDMK